jgi:Bacterial Ig-like domain (group 2)
VDDHLKLDATPYDSEGNSLIGRPVRWASENNLVAAVDQSTGDTMGKSVGTVKVTAESEGKFNAAQVTVSPTSGHPATAPPPPPPPNQSNSPSATSGGREAKIGAAIGKIAGNRPPMAAGARLPPDVVSASRAMTLAFAEKIAIASGLKFGDCPADIRILVGESLIDLKSDPQEAFRIPLGDVTYNLHGTVSCLQQTVGAVNGHGTISIVNGKTYRCVWRRNGPKDFEITLQPE